MAVEKSKGTPQTSSNDARFYRLAFRIFGEFGVTLAAPAVLGLFLGIGVDRWLGTRPWGLFVCLAVSFAASWLWIRRKAVAYAQEFERLSKKP
ncbi:MAG TPA: AtpZ/AtpI family protein [Patescibacteria group bacterium]|nr:AtpZ/AtpI family protein [Patescibacteria group bacterium]